MRVHVVDHPLIAHKLTTLRDERTDSPTFRRLADELVTLLAYEATRDVRTDAGRDHDPGRARPSGVRLAQPRPLVVPILRAGLGHARRDGPAAADRRGRLPRHGARRGDAGGDHVRRPAAGRPLRAGRCYVLDPMLATGGTLAAAIQLLIDARRRRRHRDLPAGGARGHRARCEETLGRPRRAGHRGHRRPGRAAEREAATSSRASATPATASTASSDPTPPAILRDARRHAVRRPAQAQDRRVQRSRRRSRSTPTTYAGERVSAQVKRTISTRPVARKSLARRRSRYRAAGWSCAVAPSASAMRARPSPRLPRHVAVPQQTPVVTHLVLDVVRAADPRPSRSA